jgi:hypothetical protein
LLSKRSTRNFLALVTGSATAAAAAVLVSAMVATSANATSPTEHAGARADAPRLDRVFIIMLENHGYNDVIGDPAAPNITKLAQTYAVATQYYGVTHPSEPNYIAATSGSNWWTNNDSSANVFNHTNIVDDLNARHIPWDAYMEAMPSVGYTGSSWPSSSTALYASKHNPFVLYSDILDNPAALDHVKPYTSLAGDLSNPGTAPRYVWISPDECDNMHGGIYSAVSGYADTPCPYSNSPGDANDEALKKNADNFVAATVKTIMTSRAWTPHSAIFVIADEGDYTGVAQNGGWDSPAGCCDSPLAPAGDPDISSTWPGGLYGGGLVPAIVIDPSGPHAYANGVAYNHYSLLRTIEDAWGLNELGFTSDHAEVPTMAPFLGG